MLITLLLTSTHMPNGGLCEIRGDTNPQVAATQPGSWRQLSVQGYRVPPNRHRHITFPLTASQQINTSLQEPHTHRHCHFVLKY